MGVVETAKRQFIASTLAHKVAQFSEGVMLGGSTALGTASGTSDIDLGIVVKPGAAVSVVRALGFRDRPSSRAIGLFENYGLGCAWASDVVDLVNVHCFLYNASKITDYLALKKPFTIWRPDKPQEDIVAHCFDGKERTIRRPITEMWGGYLYELPALLDGKFYAYSVRASFLGTGTILHEDNGFLTALENDAWHATIRQLTVEHGINVNMENYNVLNTLHAYHQKKLSPERIAAITKRTIKELNIYVTEL